MTLKTIEYNRAYKRIPANASIHPRKSMFAAFFTREAPHLTTNTTQTKTIRKERIGNQEPPRFIFSCKCVATVADNLRATATPTMKASSEKTATIKPLLIPL